MNSPDIFTNTHVQIDQQSLCLTGCMPWIILRLWGFLCVRDTGRGVTKSLPLLSAWASLGSLWILCLSLLHHFLNFLYIAEYTITMYDSKTREKRYTCRALLMNVKVIENLSLLTPLAFGHLSRYYRKFSLSQTPSNSLGEGATPYNGLYREGLTIGGTFCGLRVYSDEGVGISLVKAYLKR